MIRRFHIGNGRYKSLRHTRFKTYTYGRNSFENNQEELLIGPKTHGTYGTLLFDKRWQQRRLEILIRDGNRCVICENSNSLQVHHRQYHFIKALKQFKSPWDYEDQLLITLCEKCHSRGHGKFKVPTIAI